MEEPKHYCKMCQTECEVELSKGTLENNDRIAQVSKCCRALVYSEGTAEYTPSH